MVRYLTLLFSGIYQTYPCFLDKIENRGLWKHQVLTTTLFLLPPLLPPQYWTSGLLDFMRVDLFITHVILAISAVMGFLYFDNTMAGLLLAIATAIAGPVAEIVLINVPHLYIYTHADIWGICSWIPWVYFLGMIVVYFRS